MTSTKAAPQRVARKVARVGLMLITALLLLLLVLVATPIGNKSLIALANKTVPTLNIEHESGSLASLLDLKQITWQTDDIDLSITHLKVDIGWHCLAERRFCLEQITSSSVSADITPTTEQPETPVTEPGLITLPMGVEMSHARFSRIDITVKGAANLSIKDMKTALSMHNILNVRHFSWASLDVQLPEVKETTQPQQGLSFEPNSIASWQYQAPKLEPLFFPIEGKISNVQLGQIRVNQGNAPLVVIESVKTQATLDQKQLTVQQLGVQHELGQLALTAKLETNFKHQLTVELSSKLEQHPLVATIKSAGSPDDLNLNVSTDGVVPASLTVQADVVNAQLPLKAQLTWQDARWPINPDEKAQYQANQGNLTIQGNMQRYQVNLNTALSGEAIPEAAVSVALSGNQRKASLEELLVETLAGQLTASGQLTIDNAIEWLGSLTFTDIQPQVFFPQIDATLSGQSNYQARYDGKNYRASLNNFDVKGLWRDYQFKALGEGVYDSTSGLNLPQISVIVGDNQLNLNATLSQEKSLNAQLNLVAPELEQLLPTLSGELNAESTIEGSLSEPQAQFNIEGQSVVFDTLKVDSITATGGTQWSSDLAADKPISLNLSVEDITVADQKIDTVNVELTGTTQKHSSTLSIAHDKATFNTQLNGSLDSRFSQWQGQWMQGEILSDFASFSLNPTEPVILVNWQDAQYTLDPHCWSGKTAKLCVNEAQFHQGEAGFNVKIQQIPLFSILQQVDPTLAGIQSDTLLNVTANGFVKDNLPTVNVNAELTPASWSIGENGTSFTVDKFSVQAMIDKEQAMGSMSVISQQLGQITAQLTVDDIQANRQANGTITVDQIDLSYFEPLSAQLTHLNGQMNADINISGDITKPAIKGQFSIKDGALTGPLLPSEISQINQVIKLDGESATMSGSYLFGDGQGQVDGEVNWQDSPFGRLAVRGNNMEVNYQQLIRARISPDLNITFSDSDLSIKGELSVPYARVKVRELPPSALSPSDDTVIINQEQEDPSPIKALNLNIQINVDDAEANDVKVDAFGLTSDLRGHLLMTQNSGTVLGDGQLALVNGRYRAYGQDLTIRKGEVRFNGPVDRPFLDIEAIRNPEKTENGVIAGLRVTGLSQEPQISVFSVPELEQPEALSYLLRGQSISSSNGSGDTDAALANVLIGFGLSKSENRITQIGSKLGIEDFALATTGQGNDTKVAVSGSIAKGVQLRYGVGVFDSASEVALRYQLWPQLYLEAMSGLNNALDIYYQFSLEGKKTTEPKDE